MTRSSWSSIPDMAQSLSPSGNQRQQGFKGIKGSKIENLSFFLYFPAFPSPIAQGLPFPALKLR
ncbi:hypothetical protein D3800_18830 [Microcystis aeruginosa NIES-298]|nr:MULTISPECIES: hypothetical protein [Microcystis]MBE9246011.1 hypothetical protein [Microcystis aeruginosa LEGE 00239]MCA2623130.1 hypothetical protein [Microcystis sp. M19BS1]MCA2632143.1 hypothetical protein [Microcystis sp. M20BS1]QHU85184.1 hypothetical protein D3800_18830 [Microcystis aeruginosa NIES-298]